MDTRYMTCDTNFNNTVLNMQHKLVGREETTLEKIRSILAQLEYRYLVEYWEMKGVSNIHVPEVHPLTGLMFCEREDEGHVLKVYSTI
jgi:hypothetical protein